MTRARVGRLPRRPPLFVFAAALFALLAPATVRAATVPSPLDVAEGRLEALTNEIASQAQAEQALSGRLHRFAGRLNTVADRLGRLEQRSRWIERLQSSDAAGVRAPLRSLLVLRTNVDLRLAATRRAQAALLAQLEAQPLLPQLAQAQSLLSDLYAERKQALSLVSSLEASQQDAALAALGVASQGTSAVSYGQWAGLFLRTLGAPACQNNITAVVAWQAAEFTHAGWNPLATTLVLPGATTFNGSGVRNYASLDQGLDATALTLRGGPASYGYAAILAELAGCAPPEETAAAINASAWCRGCAGGTYVTGLIQQVEARFEAYARL